MEYFDVVDANRNKTNKILSRGSKLSDNEYNVGVELWIINSNKEILLTQRSSLKSHPLQWESPGGCLIAGENSIQGAIREAKEEINLNLNPQDLKLLTTHLYKKQFVDIYLINLNIDISTLILQEEEISDIKLVSISEFLELNNQNKIVPSVFERFNLIKKILI